MTDARRARTAEAFANPQVGDRFHEMYSYWVYVIAIDGERITTFESGHAVALHRSRGERKTYDTHEAFRAQFAYDTIPGFWVSLFSRGNDVACWAAEGWKPEPPIHIEPDQVIDHNGTTVIRWRWRCDCHGRAGEGWPEKPSAANARAEHDLLVGGPVESVRP